MSVNTLKERAVLMRFSAGLPGEARQDKRVTSEVKKEKQLGADSGKWQKNLYPEAALAAVKTKMNEARAYHDTVTLPFEKGIGILPAGLISEYGDKIRQFQGEVKNLVETTFLAKPRKWIDWAIAEHSGTFEPGNYPGCKMNGAAVELDENEFRTVMRKKFYLRCEPTPVPESAHFENTVASLLGTDRESVDQRVRDASLDAQREVLRRVLEPVSHMATTLAKDKPRIFETLVGNISDICKLAPKLNLAGDPGLDALVKEVETLTRLSSETLKASEGTRTEARKAAEALVAKLSAYKI